MTDNILDYAISRWPLLHMIYPDYNDMTLTFFNSLPLWIYEENLVFRCSKSLNGNVAISLGHNL